MAGIGSEFGSGAGQNRPIETGVQWIPVTGSIFGALARAQYAALAAMRWQAFRNGMRTTRGSFEAAASGISYAVYSLMGLGLTAGLAAAAYMMTSKDAWEGMPVLFWAVFATWQLTPVVIASFQQPFDLSGLLRFPMGFGPFYLLHVIFGMIDASTILGGLGCLGIWIGATLAGAGAGGWTALALAVFACFNILLSRAIFVWLDRWLAQRKTREIVSVLFLLGLLSLEFLNPGLRRHSHRAKPAPQEQAAILHDLSVAESAQSWLPPGLAEGIMQRGANGYPGAALGAMGLLGVWTVAAGLVLGARLHALHRGESLSDASAPARPRKQVRSASLDRGAVPLRRAGPVAAIMEKDLHTVLRSLPLLYSLGAPLIMVLIFASLMRGSGSAAFPLALPLCIAYALLGFTQLIYNTLGAEGAGIQLLLYSPTPMRTVLLAKNLFHAMLFAVVALAAALLAVFRLGMPSLPWLAATAAWLVFALPAHLAVGNLFSLAMPHKMNLGRIGRQRGGQAGALLSILVQGGILGVGAGVIALCSFFGRLWLATPLLLALAIPSTIVWLRVLAKSDAIALRRRDTLIAALAKVE